MEPPSRPVRQRRDAFVRKVLDTTVSELARVGLAQLSIPTIAMFAGVNKTSIYRRWPTKHALVKEALAAATAPVETVPDTGSLEGDLRALAAEVGGFVASERGRAILRTLVSEGDSPATGHLVSSLWDELGPDLPLAPLRRAIARGELLATTDATMLLFTLAGALLHRVLVERGRVDEAWTEQVVRLLLHGIQGAQPSHAGTKAPPGRRGSQRRRTGQRTPGRPR